MYLFSSWYEIDFQMLYWQMSLSSIYRLSQWPRRNLKPREDMHGTQALFDSLLSTSGHFPQPNELMVFDNFEYHIYTINGFDFVIYVFWTDAIPNKYYATSNGVSLAIRVSAIEINYGQTSPHASFCFSSLQWRHNERGDSQITGFSIVCSAVWSGADQRKHQSYVLPAFVRVTGEFPTQKASNAGDVSIWWRHHYIRLWPCVRVWGLAIGVGMSCHPCQPFRCFVAGSLVLFVWHRFRQNYTSQPWCLF